MGKPWGGVVCPPFFLPEGLNLLSLEYWRVIDSRARRQCLQQCYAALGRIRQLSQLILSMSAVAQSCVSEQRGET